MKHIDLITAKKHLNVDFNDDDWYISELIGMSEDLIEHEIGESLENLKKDGDIPKPLFHAILLLISHFYAVREPVIMGVSVNKIPYTLKFLINGFKNWTVS